MTIGNVAEYASVSINMIGSIFLAHQDRRGYVLFIMGFIPGSVFAAYYHHWGLLGLYVYYFIVNCYGFNRWRKRNG